MKTILNRQKKRENETETDLMTCIPDFGTRSGMHASALSALCQKPGQRLAKLFAGQVNISTVYSCVISSYVMEAQVQKIVKRAILIKKREISDSVQV